MSRFYLVLMLDLMVSIAWADGKKMSDSVEAFPLSNGLHFLYSYRYWTANLSGSGNGNYTTDSRIVEYHVLDYARASDTSQTWTVQETRHLLHHDFSTYPNGFDTLYRIDSTLTIMLLEDLNGNHRLQSNSLVWSFPIHDNIGTKDTSVDVFRYYAPYSHFSAHLGDGIADLIDSVFFQVGQGLVSRTITFRAGFMSRYLYRLDIGQIETPTDVQNDGPKLQCVFDLIQNYPNPFNPSTTIRYDMPSESYVTLEVFNVLGQKVATLIEGQQSVGSHNVEFNGEGLSSGMYFYQLRTRTFVQTKKMLFAK